MQNKAIGMFLIGLGAGMYIPGFPAPLNVINPYIGLIILIIGIVVLLKK